MQKTVRALKKSRGAFLTCFILGLLLVLLAAAFSLYTNATKVEVFEAALQEADVNELLDIVLSGANVPGLSGNVTKGLNLTDSIATPEALSAFAQDTIDYLVGKVEEWKPTVTVMGFEVPIPISQDFMNHMKDVKNWVGIGQKVFFALLAVCGVLVLRLIASSRCRFSGAGYYLGVILPLAIVGGIIAWAYFDFEGFWMFIHEHFIKGGIFSNGEVVMRIFTTDMFKTFIRPIVTTFAMLLGGIVLLPIVIAPLSKLRQSSSQY